MVETRNSSHFSHMLICTSSSSSYWVSFTFKSFYYPVYNLRSVIKYVESVVLLAHATSSMGCPAEPPGPKGLGASHGRHAPSTTTGRQPSGPTGGTAVACSWARRAVSLATISGRAAARSLYSQGSLAW